ncbi:MAG: hypothetical protein U5Q44_10510 [Dehalococcoidia bacterium]|nr:hypothetical protein [Dehalococcoidia bacterium]
MVSLLMPLRDISSSNFALSRSDTSGAFVDVRPGRIAPGRGEARRADVPQRHQQRAPPLSSISSKNNRRAT